MPVKKCVVILYNFQDKPLDQPLSIDQVAQYLEESNQFYIRNSSGWQYQTFDIRGWYTIPYDSTAVCDSSIRLPMARQAAIASGVDFGLYDEQIFVAAASTCGTCCSSSTVDGTIAVVHFIHPVQLSTFYSRTHELGHALGLFHSLGPTKTTWNYHSVMGYYNTEDITLFGKKRMGWYTPMEILASGTYDVSAGAKLFRDTISDYYLEYRPLASALSVGVGYHEAIDPNSDYQFKLVTPGNSFFEGSTLFEFLTSSPPTVKVTLDTIPPPPPDISITLSSDKAIYSVRQFIYLKAKVLNGTTPAVGEAVTFSIQKPDGRTSAGVSTVDAQGYAYFQYKIKPHDPRGAWIAAAYVGSKSSTVSFEVR